MTESIQTQELIYDSSKRGIPAFEELREISNYRHLIFQLARRDILTRYRRSVLGVAWTMLNPLGMMLVLTVAFSQTFTSGTPHGYPGYVLCGLMAWNFFSQTTTAATVNLVWGGTLLHRIYMPRSSFALSAILTGLLNLSLSIIPLVIVLLATGAPIRPTILLLPGPMLLLACFSLGVGLLVSTVAVYFPDLVEMFQIALTGWMWVTPVVYPVSALPQQYSYWITHLNPMYYLINLYRALLYEGRLPVWGEIWPALIISVVVLVAGWFFFSKKADEFSYRL